MFCMNFIEDMFLLKKFNLDLFENNILGQIKKDFKSRTTVENPCRKEPLNTWVNFTKILRGFFCTLN
jgi:hypothetical protein